MTLWQFENCLDGYKDRIKAADSLNHSLGSYILTAYHDPKKYPKEPHLSKEDKPAIRFTTDEQRIMAVRAKYGKKK